MQVNKEESATIISPSRNVDLRKGRGFSLSEIKASGKSLQELKNLNVPIDFLRKSTHEVNIETLKNIKITKSKSKKQKPFEPKEKRRAEFKPKKEKPAIKEEKIITPKRAKAVEKPAPIQQEPEKVKVEAKAIPRDRVPLTELSGLGPAAEKKFVELGVNCVEELILEDPSELRQLIKGISEERIKNWIEEGKQLVKK
jgi:predicted flap endonuclease-1-like 5' DNA nuclease